MTEIEIQPNNQDNKQNNQPSNNSNNSKVGIGILCGFIGLIGLLIGFLVYKEDTFERKTFIKGWLWCFIISMAVSIVVVIIVYAIGLSQLKDMANAVLLWR